MKTGIFWMQSQTTQFLFRLNCNTFANITLSGALMQHFAVVVCFILFTVVDHNLES